MKNCHRAKYNKNKWSLANSNFKKLYKNEGKRKEEEMEDRNSRIHAAKE